MRFAAMALTAAISALAGLGSAVPDARAQDAPSLDQLIERFEVDRPEVPGSARLDAWVEENDGGRAVVIVVTPEGETKLIADPGITVTPVTAGVAWLLPLPHQMIDPSTDYFAPPATIRLPYAAAEGETVSLLVEYAYCVIDFQCFFGEETLVVALDGS